MRLKSLVIVFLLIAFSGCCVFERLTRSQPSKPENIKGWHEPIEIKGSDVWGLPTQKILGEFVLKEGEMTLAKVLEQNSSAISIKLTEIYSGDPCKGDVESTYYNRGSFQIISADNNIIEDKIITPPSVGYFGHNNELKQQYMIWVEKVNTKEGWIYFTVRTR